ncbi:hypothetical protein CNY89_30495, partial [Amaricoccus sp. HAR-UPW-R2A-40]
MLRSAAMIVHARRSLNPRIVLRCATAPRLAAGVTISCNAFLQPGIVEHRIGIILFSFAFPSSSALSR